MSSANSLTDDIILSGKLNKIIKKIMDLRRALEAH